MTEISLARRYYWSVRREIWEHPSLWIAPSAAGAVALLAFLVSKTGVAGNAAARSAQSYDIAIGLVMVAAYVVAIFYSLDALYGERRDRSILFWKSLPVSDLTTVLAKLSIPVLVIPLFTFAVTVAAFLLMLLLGGAHPPLLRTSELLLYHLLTVHSLWWAPLFGWLFLVSAWVGRAPFVWATVPLIAIAITERIALGSARFQGLLSSRFNVSPEAIVAHGKLPTDPVTLTTPAAFATSWGLWLGLALTAGCVAAAVRLRRSRGPI